MDCERASFFRSLPGSFESGGEADVPGLSGDSAAGLCCVDGGAHDSAAVVTSRDEERCGEGGGSCAPGRNVGVNTIGIEGAPLLDRSSSRGGLHVTKSSGPIEGAAQTHGTTFGENLTTGGKVITGYMSTAFGVFFTI
ncbi:hypothetical protein [Methylobacterium oxalidis]|uniref:hypothetical protein n=1 Tax=Methylobacterium oxalidis TaxID=944322 RepID=UPI0033149BD7